MTETRFKPVRAGIINLWDYFDEEFAFADGRLALRGHNGSGKTKALEVLFPFVLDGSLDARRLDPFSGENRTMKANLLYRGQDSEHGYVWMEFGRPGETVTLVIGLSVHKNMDRPRPSFYVTGKRMGIEFGLLSADSRPLTAKQLTAILGRDAHYGDKKGAYQDAVDARLFGLGQERYAQLLDLLIALRRPLLAKDLDPGKVSETLTAGLSPVDDELVTQAARDFENLAAVQKQYDDLAAADAAVRAFLDQYVSYLRVHARHELDQVAARMSAAAGHLAAIGNAAREVSRSGEQEQRWREAEAEREDQHRDVPGAPVRAEEPGRVQGPREARAPARPAGEGETGPGGRAGPAGPRSRQCGRPVGRGGSCRRPAGRGRPGGRPARAPSRRDRRPLRHQP